MAVDAGGSLPDDDAAGDGGGVCGGRVVCRDGDDVWLARSVLLRGGLGRPTAAVVAGVVVLYSEPMLVGGMEVTLTLPLMLGVMLAVLRRGWWSCRGWTARCLSDAVADGWEGDGGAGGGGGR